MQLVATMVHHASALVQWSAITIVQMNGPTLQKWALGVAEQVSKTDQDQARMLECRRNMRS